MSSDEIWAVVVLGLIVAGLGVGVPAVICWRKNKKGLAVLGAFIFGSVIQVLFGDDPSGGTGYGLILVFASPLVYAGAAGTRRPRAQETEGGHGGPNESKWLVWFGLVGLFFWPLTPIVWWVARLRLRDISAGCRPDIGRRHAETAKRLGFWGVMFWLTIAAAGLLGIGFSFGA